MGWIFALLFAALTLLGLWASGRCSRLALEMALAAILIALAGYGWQGRPDMPGHAASQPPR